MLLVCITLQWMSVAPSGPPSGFSIMVATVMVASCAASLGVGSTALSFILHLTASSNLGSHSHQTEGMCLCCSGELFCASSRREPKKAQFSSPQQITRSWQLVTTHPYYRNS